MKIYRLASSKEKVNRYNIRDPFLVFFIHKYENLIPWEQVSSEQDINGYISNTLVPQLYNAIDPSSETNYYLKDIDLETEFRNNPNNPQVQQAYQIYKSDPEGAKETILESINESKKKIFYSWWEYFNKGNEIYASSPAFIFSILKPIFDRSGENDKRSPMPLNEMAVASLYNKIENSGGKDLFRVDKQYSKEVGIANQKKMESQEQIGKSTNLDGWITIPSKKNDPEGFEQNVETLTSYSIPNGWCTGSGMATPYLSKGDFHLYVVDGKAEVAIRMDGDKMAEIQGEGNQRPFRFWEQIEKFVTAKGFDQSNAHYQKLMEAKTLNESINDPQQYAKFLQDAKENISIISMLSKENLKNPKIINDITQIAENYLINPENKLRYMSYITPQAGYYDNLPPEIKTNISEETVNRIKIGIVSAVSNLPKMSSYTIIPHPFLDDEEVQGAIEQSLDILSAKEPWKIFNVRQETLEAVKDSPVIQKVMEHPVSQLIDAIKKADVNVNPEEYVVEQGWKEPEEEAYRHYGGFDRGWVMDEESYKEDSEEWKKKQQFLEERGLEDIREIAEVRDALEKAWDQYLSADVDRYEEAESFQTDYTEYYENEHETPLNYERIYEIVQNEWDARIQADPNELENAPSLVSGNYYQDYDDREYHYTTIWLNYFLNGNFEEMDTDNGRNAIDDMNETQTKKLVEGIIRNNVDIDEVPDILQDDLEEYGLQIQNRMKWEQQAEQGQQNLPFYEDVPTNELGIGEHGGIIPVYPDQPERAEREAKVTNWYRIAKMFAWVQAN